MRFTAAKVKGDRQSFCRQIKEDKTFITVVDFESGGVLFPPEGCTFASQRRDVRFFLFQCFRKLLGDCSGGLAILEGADFQELASGFCPSAGAVPAWVPGLSRSAEAEPKFRSSRHPGFGRAEADDFRRNQPPKCILFPGIPLPMAWKWLLNVLSGGKPAGTRLCNIDIVWIGSF